MFEQLAEGHSSGTSTAPITPDTGASRDLDQGDQKVDQEFANDLAMVLFVGVTILATISVIALATLMG